MTAKQLIFRDDVYARIQTGIDTLVEAVRVTLGPKARKW
jgi:chaperonin GroEL (HSP60 family)